jgi:PAS domain S-box-containing protein
MSEHDLLQSVESARGRLTALRARLEGDGAAPGSSEIVSALRDLQEMFDKVQARCGLLRQILDGTNDVVFAKHRDGRYAMINPLGAEMLGKTMAEVLGADDRALFGPEVGERIMAIDREVMSTGEPRTREEVLALPSARTTMLTTTTAWYDDDRQIRGVIGIAQDVTELRRSERESEVDRNRMRSMAAEIVISEERLRRSLAAELHNGLGQYIALARIKLSTLRSSAGVELHDPLSGIEQLVERADRSLRSITFQISPPSLHDLGLFAALLWLGENVGKEHGIAVLVEDDDSPAVADERVRVILFRAVRELLVNAARYAHVPGVAVRLSRHEDLVRITVRDAGDGFDTADAERRGYGLLGIREQLKYIGGTLQITSAPGQGTSVTLTAPATELVAGPTE